MSAYFFVALLLVLFVLCLVKNLPAYSYFTDGAKEAIDIAVSTFPYLVAIFVAVELFRASGLSALLSQSLAPVLSFFGIPKELAELVIIKPFSGSGSLAVLDGCIETYGADSYVSRAACAVMNTSETLFYITAVYFGKVGAKKLRYAVPVALLANFVGAVCACAICRVL